jgi:formylglycine-generating enzyme required for sulfatase activity
MIRVFAFWCVVLLSCFAGYARADVFNMPSGQTSITMVSVGNPGNAPDPATYYVPTGTQYGAVSYSFNIDKYDVTLGQYTMFLNAVAKTDTYGLYNAAMQGPNAGYPFGIAQTGSSGSYSYSVTGSNLQAANMPVFSETWGDAARFCNWLQNGQPTSGTEGAGTTETGAYTLNGATSDSLLMAVTRNAGATYFIPNEDEWCKAAYYDPTLSGGSGGYWTYATRSNTPPDNSLVLATSESNDANNIGNPIGANFTDPTNYLTPVGTFTRSPSYYGTFDQCGDIYNWTEIDVNFGAARGLIGGAYNTYTYPNDLGSSGLAYAPPSTEIGNCGFRVASSVPVPEPSTFALLGAAGFALLRHCRRRAGPPAASGGPMSYRPSDEI